MNIFEKISALGRGLYPTGRAFKIPKSGTLDKLNNALSASEERFYNDAVSILDGILPDNANFTSDDATDWERRLGLTTNLATSLSDRKAAILRKLQAPGVNPAKLHYLVIEHQLQLAGFNVWIHENLTNVSPVVAGYAASLIPLQYGQKQYGVGQFGSQLGNKAVNYIDPVKDLSFGLGGTYRNTFFVGGQVLGTTATIPTSRKDEFRELLLKLKATETIALLYINYI